MSLHVGFRVGATDYALPAADVLHLDTFDAATPVPGAPPYVAGLMQTRGKLVPGSATGEAVAEHDQVSEVYYVIDGSATLLTGPDLVGAKQRPNTLVTVREPCSHVKRLPARS